MIRNWYNQIPHPALKTKKEITKYHNFPKFSDRQVWANSADPDQTAPRGAVWSGSTLFAIPSASFGCITVRKSHLFQLLGWLQKFFGVSEYLGNLRICVFEHSVMTNFNCSCPAIQRGQGSGFLPEGSSWFTACMSEQRRFCRDCAEAQARLNLRRSHRR